MNGPSAVRRLDDAVDRACEPVRDVRAAAALFSVAGHAADFSIMWHAIGLIRSVGSTERLGQAVVLSVILGIESLVVNQGIKRLFGRTRPTVGGDGRFSVRTPRTSSFPSGHASSAFCAAVVLTSFGGPAWATVLWWVLATTVATSRVMSRIHHFSDVLAGAVVGAGLGLVAVAVVG